MSRQSTTIHTYTIQEAAKLTGLPESTLRYYEGIGIIEPIKRDVSSKHRVYSEKNLDVLDAIACLNATGLSISDMREYIQNRGKGAEAADEQVKLLEKQQRRLQDEARLITVRQDYVTLKIAYWKAVAARNDTLATEISSQAKRLTGKLKKGGSV